MEELYVPSVAGSVGMSGLDDVLAWLGWETFFRG